MQRALNDLILNNSGENVLHFDKVLSRNLGTIFLPPASKMYNYVDKNDFDDKVGIISNELLFFVGFIDV